MPEPPTAWERFVSEWMTPYHLDLALYFALGLLLAIWLFRLWRSGRLAWLEALILRASALFRVYWREVIGLSLLALIAWELRRFA
jgi:hypothetical protein